MSFVGAIAIEIGGLPIIFHLTEPDFARLLTQRYAHFLAEPATGALRFDVTITAMTPGGMDDGVEVQRVGGSWRASRGDFEASWEIATGHGELRQSLNPWSFDSVLRVVHSLMLAERGGFLLHAASGISNSRAFLFCGVSGVGKSTIMRVAPADVVRLTDEISYVRKVEDRYLAFGTPFSGELEISGVNASAPIAALHFLAKGLADHVGAITFESAARRLLRNILFFSNEPQLSTLILGNACDFLESVPFGELTFRPQVEVWRLMK
jgi:hypothetical protein